MQVPEKKGKARVSFRVTMMLTMTLMQVLAAAGTCSEHLGRMGSLCNSSLLSSTGGDDDSNPMRRMLSSSHPVDDSKPRRRDSGGFPGPREMSTCLPASASLFPCLSLPSHQQLCPLVRMSLERLAESHLCPGRGDITRSWTTDSDKEG